MKCPKCGSDGCQYYCDAWSCDKDECACLWTEWQQAEIERQAREIKILELKNSASLANNLCPDCRDKQAGKPCLACTIQKLEREIERLRGEVEILEAKRADLQRDLSSANEYILESVKNTSTLENENDDWQKMYLDLAKTTESLHSKLKAAREEVEATQLSKGLWMKDYADECAKNADLRAEVKTLSTDNSRIYKESMIVKAENDTLKAQLAEKDKEVADGLDSFTEQNKRMCGVLEELIAIKAQHAEAESELKLWGITRTEDGTSTHMPTYHMRCRETCERLKEAEKVIFRGRTEHEMWIMAFEYKKAYRAKKEVE